MALITASKPYQAFADKMSDFLVSQYPGQIDKASTKIFIGRNQDSAPGSDAGFRITGRARDAAPIYMETPDKVIPDHLIANRNEACGGMKFVNRVSDAANEFIQEAIKGCMSAKGMSFEEAKQKVFDGIDLIGYKDQKTGEFVAEPIIKGVNDADVQSLNTPFWNITYMNKIFKQPMLTGYARRLVAETGVANVWADAVSIWTESFEGMARVANVAKTTGQHNINEASKTRTGQIISEFVNIVADFETSASDGIYGGLNGNPLTNAAIGDNEKYTRLMLEQMHNALLYFGDTASGFEGLAQQTVEIQWDKAPFEYIYNDATNSTKGADMLETLNTMIGDWLEELNFLPTKVRINCSPTMYKCLKWSLTSKVYNPSSPLKFIAEGFDGRQKFMETTPGNSMDDVQRYYEFYADPMLAATDSANGLYNPFNNDDTDLMYVTFPEFQSDLEEGGLTDVVMAPVAISNMVLPYFYGNSRDGQGRTMLKRIGSVLCPVDGAVKIIRGIGRNLSYTPAS